MKIFFLSVLFLFLVVLRLELRVNTIIAFMYEFEYHSNNLHICRFRRDIGLIFTMSTITFVMSVGPLQITKHVNK